MGSSSDKIKQTRWEKELLKKRKKNCWEPWPSSHPAGTELVGKLSDISCMTQTMAQSCQEPPSPGSSLQSSIPSTTPVLPPSGMSVFSSSSKLSQRLPLGPNGNRKDLSSESIQVLE